MFSILFRTSVPSLEKRRATTRKRVLALLRCAVSAHVRTTSTHAEVAIVHCAIRHIWVSCQSRWQKQNRLVSSLSPRSVKTTSHLHPTPGHPPPTLHPSHDPRTTPPVVVTRTSICPCFQNQSNLCGVPACISPLLKSSWICLRFTTVCQKLTGIDVQSSPSVMSTRTATRLWPVASC